MMAMTIISRTSHGTPPSIKRSGAERARKNPPVVS
jgi:hypothetical protein